MSSRAAAMRRESVNSVSSDRARRTSQPHALRGSVSRDSFSSNASTDVRGWLDSNTPDVEYQTDAQKIMAREWLPDNQHLRTALLANASKSQRKSAAWDTAGVDLRSASDLSRWPRVRRKIVNVLESNPMQMVMITLVLVEMLAVIFELLLETGFLSFNADYIDQPLIVRTHPPRMPRAPAFALSGASRAQTTLHYVSVTILLLFELEFLVLFFAIGFKFCCRAWLLIDVVIVTVALITELYMHNRPRMADPGEEEDLMTKDIIFVVTLRIIRIVHCLFTQFLRHEDRIARTLAELEDKVKQRWVQQFNEILKECDGLREELQKERQHVQDLQITSKVQADMIGVLRERSGVSDEELEELLAAGKPMPESPEQPQLMAGGSLGQAERAGGGEPGRGRIFE